MARPNRRRLIHDAILTRIREQPVSKADLLRELGIPERTLYRALNDLRDEGHRIVSFCEGRKWRYTLLKSIEEGLR